MLRTCVPHAGASNLFTDSFSRLVSSCIFLQAPTVEQFLYLTSFTLAGTKPASDNFHESQSYQHLGLGTALEPCQAAEVMVLHSCHSSEVFVLIETALSLQKIDPCK